MDYLRLQQAAMVFIVVYVKFVVEVVVDRSQDADALAAVWRTLLTAALVRVTVNWLESTTMISCTALHFVQRNI